MQSASDTFSEALIISSWYKHRVRHHDEEKWIGHARLLAEVPSISIEYCEVYQKAGSSWIPWSRVNCLYLPVNKDDSG